MSDNRIEPKLFWPLLAAISTMTSLRYLNISWNLLLEKARGPQIGTFIKEEKLIYGRADEKIVFPDPPAKAQETTEAAAP